VHADGCAAEGEIGILLAEVTRMAGLTAEQAKVVSQLSLMSVKKEHGTTRSVIAAIPANGGDYKPEPVAKTALELAWHIVASEHRFFAAVADGAFDFSPQPKPENLKDSADMAKYYDELLSKDDDRLATLSGDQLAKVIDFRGMFQMPAVAFLDMGLRHSVHHRGQLSTYLRPAGGKVPAIYGESYDSKNKS
jgi:uncharacterized damage-inducible protein DinB